MIYLRRTGRKVPPNVGRALGRSGATTTTTWSVRDSGVIVGFVAASTHPTVPNLRERHRGFRGFTATGSPVTPIDLGASVLSRTYVRNLTASRRSWA